MSDPADFSDVSPSAGMQGSRVVQHFSNRKALFLWGFAAVLLLFVTAMSLVLVRDGAPPEYRVEVLAALMLLFWCGALGLAGFAASHPCIVVTVNDRALVTILWRYPLGQRTRIVSPPDIASVSVVDAFDSEGEPYFHARIVLQDGSQVDFAEGHYRPFCVSQVQKLTAALAGRDH